MAVPPAAVYYVGKSVIRRAGEAIDEARRVARELALSTGHGQNVDVVRSDGEKVRIRGYLDSRGQPASITLPRAGRRW